MKTEIIEKGLEQIIQLEFADPLRLEEIEQHHVEFSADICACPASMLVKHQLSAYFFEQRYGQPSNQDPELLQWMQLIYRLNAKFAKLEHLINRPRRLDDLEAEFSEWIQDLDASIHLAEITEPRLLQLIFSFRAQLTKAMHHFIHQAQNASHLGLIYTQHDISFQDSSLGRFIHTQLYACLDMAKKGAEHLSGHPWKNLFIQDPAILALATAQDQLYEQAFSFQGIAKTNPYQPYHHDFMRRLNLNQATKIEYCLPKHHLITAEYWVANFYQLSLNSFKSSTYPFITFTQFLLFPYELSLMLVHLLGQILIILPLRLWSEEQSQQLANRLENYHLSFSIYHYLQQYKNHLISKNWQNNPELPELAKSWLMSHLNQEHLFSSLPKQLFKPKPKNRQFNAATLSFADLLHYLKHLPFQENSQNLSINTQITQPVNQLKTAVDIIESIALILGRDAILPFFRQHPLPASLNFLLSSATWITLNTPILGYSPLHQITGTLQNWISSLGRAYMGKVISQDLASSMAACFLYWQLSLSGFQLTTRLINQQDDVWWRNLSQAPDKICLGASALMLLGYLEAILPVLPTHIHLGQDLSLYNPVFAFINIVHHEAEKCLDGLPPFNDLSLAVIGIKSTLFLYNLFQSNPSLQQAERPTSVQVSLEHHEQPKLLLLLKGLALKDRHIQAALTDKNLAKTYFLQLAEAFKTHPQPLAYQPFLQQFYRLYCQTRVFNLLRAFNIILLPLHAIEWAYGLAKENVFHQYAGQTKVAEDFYLLSQFIYALLHPIFLCLRVLNNYIILAALRLPIFTLIHFLPMGQMKLSCMAFDDKLRYLYIHEQLMHLLRPLQVLHAKLAFHSGCYPDLSGQAEVLLNQMINPEKKTQANSLGFQGKT